MGGASPKKGPQTGSAKIPGLFNRRFRPHLEIMMETKHANPRRLVPLIPILRDWV